MKRIRLRGEIYVLLDDEDYPWIIQWPWHLFDVGRKCYAATSDNCGGNITMHRLLTVHPKGLVVHHIDENPLNNQKENLEVLTYSEHQLKHNL